MRRLYIGFIVALTCVLPTVVHAWTLNTWVKSAGGNIVSRNLATPQTVTNGSVFRNYTTHANLPVTINTNAGYSVTLLQINGVTQPLPVASGTTYQLGLTSYPSITSQSVFVTFGLTSYTLTAVAGSGGTVSPASISPVYPGAQTPAKTFTFIPDSGKSVTNIVVTGGHLLNTDYTLVNATTNAPVTLPAGSNVRVRVSFNNVKGSATATGSFAVVGANAGPAQTVLSGSTAILDGSASTGATSYAWTQVSGPASVTIGNAGSVTATFDTTGKPLGAYQFMLSINGGSSTSTTTVYVTTSAAAAARGQCQNCHQSNNIGTTANVFPNWSSSRHKDNLVMCFGCHVGTNTGGHPGSLVSGTVQGTTFNFVSSGANFCATCHDPSIPADFAGSVHVTPAGASSCSFCHANVHFVNAACVDCHTPDNPYGLPWPPTGFSFHEAYTGTTLCSNCHPTHNPSAITGMTFPHFSNYSTAQFVTTNITCDNCHKDALGNFQVYSANRQWARSGKANPKSPAYIGPGPSTEANLEAYDFKSLGTPQPAKPSTSTGPDCVRCHTTTGFIAYVTPTVPENPATAFSLIEAWGTPGDRTREMVACNACHNNATGFDADFSRRGVGFETDPVFYPGVNNVAAWYGYSSAATKKIIRAKSYANPAGEPMNDSNLCIVCHTGKAAGDLIKLSSNCSRAPSIVCRVGATGPFWTNLEFFTPHNMNAANLMFPDGLSAGYDYRPATSISPYHTNVGLETSQGPCVGCHMSSPEPHSFRVTSRASDGTITSIDSPVCATCHGVIALPVDAADVENHRQGYKASLQVIIVQLAAKGIYYNQGMPPYYFTTPDISQQSSATQVLNWDLAPPTYKGADMMGAAFNLRLLDSGAGWIHNSGYSKRLLYDSIDFLDDGLQNNSVATTIQNIPGIDQTVKSKATAYIVPRI